MASFRVRQETHTEGALSDERPYRDKTEPASEAQECPFFTKRSQLARHIGLLSWVKALGMLAFTSIPLQSGDLRFGHKMG